MKLHSFELTVQTVANSVALIGAAYGPDNDAPVIKVSVDLIDWVITALTRAKQELTGCPESGTVQKAKPDVPPR